MKLLIDIDEKKYEEIKRIAKAQFELADKTEAQIIASGTPISTDDDLIGRSDLKQAINNVVDEEIGIDEKWAKGLKYSIKIIDKVPTVNIIQHKDWYLVNMAGAKELLDRNRPHSEWIEKYCDYGVYYLCSNCHKMPSNYECDYKEGAIKTNYCPNCGADMRGDSNG